jgi:hypothetical protein
MRGLASYLSILLTRWLFASSGLLSSLLLFFVFVLFFFFFYLLRNSPASTLVQQPHGEIEQYAFA